MSCVYIKRYILISIASFSVFLPLIQPEWFTDIQVNIYNYSSTRNSVRIQWSTAITDLQAIFYKANDSLGLALKKQKILLFHGIPLGLPRQFIHSPFFLLSLSHSLSFPLSTSLSPSLLLSFRPLPPSQLSLCTSKYTTEKLHFWGWPVVFPTVRPSFPQVSCSVLADIVKLWRHKPHRVNVAVRPNTSVNVTEVSALYIITAVHFSALTVMLIPGKD